MKKFKKPHAAWRVAVGCCCIQAGVLGLLVNSRGLFMNPVCVDLGFGLSSFTVYGIFFGVACCASIPLAERRMRKKNIRTTLALSASIMAAAQFACGFFNYVWQWWVAAAVQGAASAFLFSLTTPILINNWFEKRKGLALGLTGASSGIAGALINPAGSAVIKSFGWRAGYGFIGVLFFLMVVPAVIFLIRFHPSDEGKLPYGYSGEPRHEDNGGLCAADTLKRPDFLLLTAFMAIMCLLTCYAQMLSGLGDNIGMSAESAALMVSLAMIGNVIIKLLLGQICDRAGVRAGLFAGVLLLILGFALLSCKGPLAAYAAGAFLMGAAMSVTVVVMPLIVKGFFGGREYNRKYAYITMAGNLFSAIGISFFGLIVGKSGYLAAQITGGGLAILALALAGIAGILNKRGSRRYE